MQDRLMPGIKAKVPSAFKKHRPDHPHKPIPIMRLVEIAHQEASKHLKPGDFAIDATVGNGADTSFLAEKVGATGRVYGFDIQSIAIDITTFALKTRKLLKQVTFFQESHAHMLDRIPQAEHGQIHAILFNLGYLPHGDKSIITRKDSTLVALGQSLTLLAPGGVISVLAYRGHEGGEDESDAVLAWTRSLDPDRYSVSIHEGELPQRKGPVLTLIRSIS